MSVSNNSESILHEGLKELEEMLSSFDKLCKEDEKDGS